MSNIKKVKNGLFVVIEGMDGSGKTTAAHNLVNRLEKEYKTIYVREPGSDKTAEKIRDIVLHTDLSNRERTLLFAASMSINMRKQILPKLEEGYIIVCDRFIRSTWVYQGFYDVNNFSGIQKCKKINNQFNELESFAVYNRMPDIEFLLKIDPEIAYSRTHKRGEETDVFESKGIEFFKSLADGYSRHNRFLANPYYIDAEKDPKYVVSRMINIINHRIDERGSELCDISQ